MRMILTAIAVAATAAPSLAADLKTGSDQRANCPRTNSHLAAQADQYRGKPAKPRKLGELPAGTSYMAVYRKIGGCEAPLTMVDYRSSPRR